MSGDDQSSVDFKVDTEDLMKALIQMQSMQSDAIGAPKVGDYQWFNSIT